MQLQCKSGDMNIHILLVYWIKYIRDIDWKQKASRFHLCKLFEHYSLTATTAAYFATVHIKQNNTLSPNTDTGLNNYSVSPNNMLSLQKNL